MRFLVVLLAAGVFVVPVFLTGSGGRTTLSPAAAAITGFLLLGFALLLLSSRRKGEGPEGNDDDPAVRDRYYLATLILVGFAVRVLVAAAIHRLRIDEVVAPDEETFHANGQQFCLWLQGATPYRLSWRFLDSLQVGYYYLVGTIYYLFGVERFLPVLLNCALGALTALPVFGIAKDLGGREAGRPAALLVTFFPSVLLWSTLLIRDTLVILMLLLIIRTVMKLRREFSLPRALLLLLFLMGLGTLRQYLFVLVAASAVASFLVGRAGRAGRSFLVGITVIVGLLVVMRFAGFGLWSLERASLYQLNLHRQFNTVEGAAGTIAPDVDISEPANAITYLPVGMFYFLGSPFPWQVLNARQIMALPDVLTWYLLLPPIVLGLVTLVRRRFRDSLMLLTTITLITVLYSLVEGNVGIIFRHRAQIIVPMMVCAGVGIAVRSARRAERTIPELEPVPEGAPA